MKSSYLLLLLLSPSLSLSCTEKSTSTAQRGFENEEPIIGVVAQKHSESSTSSYIAVSDVKFLESAGARVVPIPNNSTEAEIKELFGCINGVLFPGSDTEASLNSSGYERVGQIIFNLAIQANDKGDHFPVWGTGLGFELLAYIVSGNNISVLSQANAINLKLPLTNYVDGYGSCLYIRYQEPKESLTYYNNHLGVTTETFSSNQKLNQFFAALSTNKDWSGEEFVSSMKAKQYPIYGVQYHPEKNAFEWSACDKDIPHSKPAVMFMQSLANCFVCEARQSGHKFTSREKEEAALIYNYCPVYSNSVHEYRF